MKEEMKKKSITNVPISQGQSSSSVPSNQNGDSSKNDPNNGDGDCYDDVDVPDDVDDDEDNSSIP
jgi:hypothetical protein